MGSLPLRELASRFVLPSPENFSADLQESNSENRRGKKILIITDAWIPQTNGVVTTLKNLRQELSDAGYHVCIISPRAFPTVPSVYPGVRFALPVGLGAWMDRFQPDRVFIPTEGPLGFAGRNHCLKRGIPFTTAYTTRWPQYLKAHWQIPEWITEAYLRWFHGCSHAVAVSTPSLRQELISQGYQNLALCPRGVDTKLFKPVLPEVLQQARQDFSIALSLSAHVSGELPRPFYLYVGRISKEKNLEVFLSTELPGTKILVGQGPDLAELQRKYPEAIFLGSRSGQELADCYAGSDVFVFPSLTDTFGLVILEALASGLPVVAYDVTGPGDILKRADSAGFLAKSDDDFVRGLSSVWAQVQAGAMTPEACRELALRFSWKEVSRRLLAHLKTTSKRQQSETIRKHPVVVLFQGILHQPFQRFGSL